jgi:hypothetical protein
MINRHCNCGCDESDFDPSDYTTSSTDCFIILECGDYILQESGCKILKEIQ